MITKKQVKDQIRGMNGDFTLGDKEVIYLLKTSEH
jgi:hypothetical protein